jgi:mRNA interferase RelE/StbE
VSLTVVFRETALRNLARIRSDDKDLFVRARQAVPLLADQPYPESAVAWGATSVYRLHAGDVRVLYEVDEEAGS